MCMTVRMRQNRPVVAVVDDETALREALDSLLRSAGFRTITFVSAEEFLALREGDGAGCLILDMRLPGMSGLELQRHLAAKGCNVPIVFITAQEIDPELRAQALAGGARACLRKPFHEVELLTAVRLAVMR
jgi:FixJ family two-component response regulator